MSHGVVNRSKEFVKMARGQKTSIDALEGAYDFMKKKAHILDLSLWSSYHLELEQLETWKLTL